MKFKVGDKVVKVDGSEWLNGDKYQTILSSGIDNDLAKYKLNHSYVLWFDDELKLYKEELKLNCRKQNNPKAISILDYTIIEALKKQIPKEVDTDTIDRGVGISGEYDIDFNMLCPNCKEVVGEYESNELYYKYCPNCGQKLKYTESHG